MAELSLLAASNISSSPFHQEHSTPRAYKEFQKCLPSPRTKEEILRSNTTPMLEDPWRCMGWVLRSSQYVQLLPTIKQPLILDVQESHLESEVFSFGDEEQSQKRQHILSSSITNTSGMDSYRIPFRGHHDYQLSLMYSRTELFSMVPLVDFMGDSSLRIQAHEPDKLVPSSGTERQMKNLISIVREFSPSKNLATLSNQLLLVPHFTRTETSEAWTVVHNSSSKLQTVTVAPLKSPKRTKLKPSPKKRNTKKVGKERDLYKRSSFHACESLLSLVLDKRHGNTPLLDLKNFDQDLPQLLTQFSSGIAGAGLAVVFSVVCKVAGGSVPFCASKMLNTGFGLGLVWLSWAVNKLRDNIVCITKNNASKEGTKDKEMVRRFDKCLNEIFFRAAAVLMFAVLRFA